jgi:hypothetical protein
MPIAGTSERMVSLLEDRGFSRRRRLGRCCSARSAKRCAQKIFLRRQLAFYSSGKVTAPVDPATRITLVLLARSSIGAAHGRVQPATVIRWHRAGWRLLWRMKSWARCRRPPAKKSSDPQDGQGKRPRGEERIANELLFVGGAGSLSRTVRKARHNGLLGETPGGDLRDP